jgi:hypothetical protein
MKTILTALAMIVSSYGGAYAQTKDAKACGTKENQVCRVSKDKSSVSCYKTQYANNFKVCKGEHNYFICCQEQSRTNSTPKKTYANQEMNYVEQKGYITRNYTVVDMSVPQNQSYANTSHSSLAAGYPNSGKNACYVGDNVAENNRAPYKGCASPQSDGPEANSYRNLNVSNTRTLE